MRHLPPSKTLKHDTKIYFSNEGQTSRVLSHWLDDYAVATTLEWLTACKYAGGCDEAQARPYTPPSRLGTMPPNESKPLCASTVFANMRDSGTVTANEYLEAPMLSLLSLFLPPVSTRLITLHSPCCSKGLLGTL